MTTITLRDLVAIGFRRKRLITLSFVTLSAALLLLLSLQPKVYETEMKIIVKQSRVDPLVTPDPQLPQRVGNLTEQDLESEAELLRSRDVLEGAAAQCRMRRPTMDVWQLVPVVNAFGAPNPQHQEMDLLAVSKAARDLAETMEITPLKNSDVISVTYSSGNPTQAACILKSVGKLYLDKHLAVHRPEGAFEFFKQEADHYKQELLTVETQLTSFGQEEDLVTDGTEKELSVKRLHDYRASVIDTKTAIAETKARIRQLEAQQKTTDRRTVRSIRTGPNEALKELQTQLVTLELKHTEMTSKFAPTYRPLLDLEKQIQDVKNAIEDAQKTPMVEQTTDTNPADDWLKVELAKAHSDLASLQAGTSAKEQAVQQYQTMVLDLDQKNIRRTDLIRTQKTAEEKYLLYLRKQEEARIEQELDKQQIMNVAIAEEPTVPVLPQPAPVPAKFGLLLASCFSLCLGFAADWYDRSFRTPAEVERWLNVPVIAAVPLVGDEFNSNRETTL
jgi:uncharacterized protein involved in exopolysaccharide biosynthesis